MLSIPSTLANTIDATAESMDVDGVIDTRGILAKARTKARNDKAVEFFPL